MTICKTADILAEVSSTLADHQSENRVRPAQKTKILCFVPHFGSGGAERHLLRLLNHFDRSDLQPVLAVARSGGSYETSLCEDVPVHPCGWDSLPSATLRMQSAIPHLQRVLETERPSVVLAFVDHAVAALAKALATMPSRRPLFIAGIQNNLEMTLQHLPLWNRRWLSRAILDGYTRADRVIALSSGVGEKLVKQLPTILPRLSIIPNAGYDSDVERLAQEPPAMAIPEGPWFLGCGRLTPQKDFLTLLRAFATIKAENNGQLWILGEGEMRASLEREIAALNLSERVRLPGFVSNPFAFMARATTFILSSRWEGFGNVLTEAMACGTPVISTDCPNGPGEILQDGQWGELVKVGDVAGLAQAMRRSLHERKRFQARAESAREYVVRFEARQITREYEQLIRSALKSKRRTSS